MLLPKDAAALIREDVATWGQNGVETGALLLGRNGEVDTIAWPGAKDVVRRRDQFVIGGLALAQLFDWASDNDRVVQALVHSHGGEAFLSKVDLEHGFSVPGFVSAIVPYYRRPSPDAADWRWWRFEGSWQEIEPPQITDSSLQQITFDTGGVA